MSAKNISLFVKIFVVAFITISAILKWCGVLNNVEIKEICIIGGVMAGVFGDVSLNKTLDKFTKGGENE